MEDNPNGGNTPSATNHEPNSEPQGVSRHHSSSGEPTPLKKNTGSKKVRKIFRLFKRLSRKQVIIIFASLGLLIASGIVFAITRPEPEQPVVQQVIVKPEPEPEPEPEPIISPMTGREVTKAQQELPVTAVMIENSPDARPQSGLEQADMVYEAIAEGGITRFLALYHESQPSNLGPVRSVRPYYLDFLVPFDAAVAHAGGSAQALAEIRHQQIKDLDQAFNPSYYRRINTRYAPHNLYTSRADLLRLHKEKGYNSSKYTTFGRKKDKPATQTTSGKASKVVIDMSTFTYNPTFTYDKKTNSYKRTMAGAPHLDQDSGKQINPKVVIVPVMHHGYAGIYSVYQNSGSGKVYVLQDGTVQTGTWKKKNRTSPLQIVDKNNKPIKLNVGQTWITLAGADNQVVVTP